MKINFLKKQAFLLTLSFIILFSTTLSAQPPVQGPPPAPDPYQSIGVGIITLLLKGSIKQTVDSANAKISRESGSTDVKAKLSFTHKIFKPGMSVTTFTDRPNENVVRIAYMVEYNVTDISYKGIPYFSRKINQSITVFVSCKNWFTNNGAVNIAANIDKPFLDNASFSEQALNFFIGNTLLDFVSSKIRQTLPAAFKTSTNWPNSTCNCLSVKPGDPPQYESGEIKYALKKTIKPPIEIAFNQVTVALKSIKRLKARDESNGILYAPNEDIQISFYANQTLRVTSVTQIKEEEQRNLSVPNIVLPRPGSDGLVVLISNVEQSNFTKDSRFVVFNKSNNFGNGVQKLVIQKSYWRKPQKLPNGQMTKPIEVKVNAYELAIEINAPTPVVGSSKSPNAKKKSN